MKTEHDFFPDADRYTADDILLFKGYCQVDTEQDFHGYGNWIHLDDLKAVSFAEGDLYRITFESEDEVRGWLAAIPQLKHVDCGLSNREHNLARAKALGISDMAA